MQSLNQFSMSNLDIAIVAIYALVVLAVGYFVSKKNNTGEELFLAGRSLGWRSIGMSLFASNISSTTLIGVTGAAYTYGIAVSNYEWAAGLILVFLSFYVLPVYLTKRISTIPEYLELRFGRSSRLYFSAISIFLSIVVDTAGSLYAGSVVLKLFFPSFEIWQICLMLSLFTGLYTAFGGLRAVVYTDVIQAIALLLGSILITYNVFSHFDFSIGSAFSGLPEGHMSLLKPLSDEFLPWLGTLLGVPILGFWYWGTNQYITQRLLAARSLSEARKGAMLAGFLKLTPLFFMAIPGALAFKLIPNVEKSDMVFSFLIAKFLPSGVFGLVLSGLLAAIMSSIDSTLNSASALLSYDFFQAKKMEEKKQAQIGRVFIVILMIVATLWAPMIENFGGLFSYLQQAFSIVVPPIVTIFIFGVFSKRGGARTSIITLIIGHLLGIFMFCLNIFDLLRIHFTINVGLMFGVSSLLFYFLSSSEQTRIESDLSLSLKELAQDRFLSKKLYILSVVLISLTIAMLILFR